jgi:transcriptional regulator of arginine metabolism
MYDTSNMIAKRERQEAIADLVRGHAIKTQAELSKKLARQRLEVDQSTLSRDLTELGIHKAGGRYVLSNGEDTKGNAPNQYDLSGFVEWFTPCGPHMIVVKTLVGQGQPISIAIEDSGETCFLAAVAGDDTIFLAIKSARTQAVALRRLEQWFGPKRR